MDFARLALNTFAVAGIAATIYVLYRSFQFLRGEDAPIRVKGGSIHVINQVTDWELDHEESHREYHTKGQPRRWKVEIWKNEADIADPPVKTLEGRRVVVHVDDGSGGATDYRLVFRANGAARVVDQDGQLTHSGKELSNGGAGHRMTRVVVKTKGSADQVHTFGVSEKGFLKLWPQP